MTESRVVVRKRTVVFRFTIKRSDARITTAQRKRTVVFINKELFQFVGFCSGFRSCITAGADAFGAMVAGVTGDFFTVSALSVEVLDVESLTVTEKTDRVVCAGFWEGLLLSVAAEGAAEKHTAAP
jgi:hypothetical protein